MMLRRFIAAALTVLAVSAPARAAQNSVVMPETGPMSFADYNTLHMNPALLSLLSCNSSNTPPANGPGNAPAAWECWIDTSTSPNNVYKIFDGTQWIAVFTLDGSAHSATVTTSEPVNSQSGTTYSIVDGDRNKLVRLTNASAVAVSIAQAGAAGSFPAGWSADLKYTGAATATITPATSTIDGAVSLALAPGQGIRLISDGTNYSAWRGMQVPATTCPTHQWVNFFSATGVPACQQPALADLSDAATIALLASPAFTGVPTAPTAAVDTNTTQLATTAMVIGQAASATPLINGTATVGTSTRYARGDHVHPTDTTRAPLASPALTGTPTTPTASPGTNSTQIASTAYADAIAALKANANRNITTGCGLSGGGDLSADRTLRLSLTINAQIGTSYTVVDGDCGKLVSLSNASAVAVTLPQANGSTFISGWSIDFQNKGAGTATITPTTSTVNGASTLILTQNQGAHCDSDGTNYTCMLGVGAGGGAGTVTSVVAGTGLGGGTITASGTITAPSIMPQGRLTLQTGTPVMTTSQTAKGTIFYDCYLGNTVPYFDGTKDAFDTISSCEVSTTMVSAASAGQVPTGSIYDVFWVHGGASRICVAMSSATGGGGGWSSDSGTLTSRGTGFSVVDRTRGYVTNTNSITNCFNGATNYGPVSAHQGTYLGSFVTDGGAGKTSFTFGSNATGGGQNSGFYLWNSYNRIDVKTSVSDSATSWTITDGNVHNFHDDAGTRLNFVAGLAEDWVGVNLFQEVCSNASQYQIMAIGFALDRSGNTTFDRVAIQYSNSAAVIAGFSPACGSLSVNSTYAPQIGFHFIQALENQDGQAFAWTGTYSGGIRTSFDGYLKM